MFVNIIGNGTLTRRNIIVLCAICFLIRNLINRKPQNGILINNREGETQREKIKYFLHFSLSFSLDPIFALDFRNPSDRQESSENQGDPMSRSGRRESP